MLPDQVMLINKYRVCFFFFPGPIKGMRCSGSGLGRSTFLRLKHPGVFLERLFVYTLHGGGRDVSEKGEIRAVSCCLRQRNTGRALLPGTLLGSLESSSSYITYLWQY